MAYRIELKPVAVKQLSKLEPKFQAQIIRKIDALAEEPRPPGVVRLLETENLFRIRSGNYRVIYQINDDKLFVLVVRIGDRKEVSDITQPHDQQVDPMVRSSKSLDDR